jgi:hypothetical protein
MPQRACPPPPPPEPPQQPPPQPIELLDCTRSLTLVLPPHTLP